MLAILDIILRDSWSYFNLLFHQAVTLIRIVCRSYPCASRLVHRCCLAWGGGVDPQPGFSNTAATRTQGNTLPVLERDTTDSKAASDWAISALCLMWSSDDVGRAVDQSQATPGAKHTLLPTTAQDMGKDPLRTLADPPSFHLSKSLYDYVLKSLSELNCI